MARRTWGSAADLSCMLRGAGHAIPLSDLLIAILAIEHGLLVFSTDPHFTRIPRLRLYDDAHGITS